MAVAAADVAGVVKSATANAGAIERGNEQLAAGDPEAGSSSGFDVWSQTAAGMGGRMDEDPEGPDRALGEGVSGEWARTDAGGVEASLDRQATDAMKEFQLLTGQREPEEGEAAPEGFLAGVGATFGVLTSLEQMISAPLSMLPFPAFPAIRVTDMDVGLPHGHTHPPNVPPTPPAPFPSTGPIIPIPFLSGATRTLVNGMPAARCGDMGLGVWCGGYFPMYEVFLGSSSVWIEGARAGRLLVDVTRHCMFSSPRPSDPPLGPMVGMTITSSPNVLIGGVPMPSLLDMAMGAAIQGLFKGISKAVKKVKAARAADDLADFSDAAPLSRIGSRPSSDDLWQSLVNSKMCDGDQAKALELWAASRRVVDDLLDSGKISIDNPALRGHVIQDLYMMGTTPVGRRSLQRIRGSNQRVVIRPQRGVRDVASRQAKNAGDGLFSRSTGDPGPPVDTHIHYDPTRKKSPNSRPDVVLNHEMGHAANNAEGMNHRSIPADRDPRFQKYVDSGAMTGDEADDATQHLWSNKEEQNVIQNVDNPYRDIFDLEQRSGHRHSP